MQHRPAPRALALALGLAPALFACGGADSGDAGAEDSAHRPKNSSLGGGGADAEGDVLLEGSPMFVPEAVRMNVERKDARTDGWRTEVLHDLAKPGVHDFLHHLIDPDHATPWDELLTEDFRTVRLRPRQLELVYEQGATRVHRPSELDPQSFPAGEVGEIVSELREPFEGTGELHERIKIQGITENSPTSFLSEVIVQIYAVGEGAAAQVNAAWNMGWEVTGEDEGVRLRSVEVLRHEEVASDGPLFGELTRDVFASFPRYDEEFLRDAQGYQFRTDLLIGNPFWGHQGAAIGDVNGDGLEDLYVCQIAGLPNRLFLHEPDGTVRDHTEASLTGYLENTASALLLDMDEDGERDLVLALGQLVAVSHNRGNAVFDAPVPLRGESEAPIYSLSAADPDLDGDLDLYACRHSNRDLLYEIPTPYFDANNGSPNSFFQNQGAREYVDATEEVGLDENNTKFSYASTWEDFDEDGDPELYVANDFGRNNLYQNEDGRFRDIALEAGALDISAGMGASCADFDLDGDVDVYVSNMYSSAGRRIVPQSERFMGGENRDYHEYFVRHARGNTLLANNGDGTFEDVTDERGVAPGGWAWGAKFLDFNNDGLPDIHSPCGFATGRDTEDL